MSRAKANRKGFILVILFAATVLFGLVLNQGNWAPLAHSPLAPKPTQSSGVDLVGDRGIASVKAPPPTPLPERAKPEARAHPKK